MLAILPTFSQPSRAKANVGPMMDVYWVGEYLKTRLKDHTIYDRGPEIHGKPRRVSLPVGEAQLAGCLRVKVGGLFEWTQASSDYAQGVIQDTVNEASVSTATPDWRTVLSC